ncbi:MAG TPA: PfkB family carbohydrate kinase [Acidobacteriota bacterium]|jgi:rfaE bifunctional protein kinase chain/domain|nr:PfkB family carbohydrate kinase [Acidobacteriota bacterium]
MNLLRLRAILRSIQRQRILVIGDFFLDKYLIVDSSLKERSLETSRPAHQVVAVRRSPGGAGTVTSNLAALGAETHALGIAGEDGEGWDLLRGLQATRVHTDLFIHVPGHLTGAYIKPMLRSRRGERETERLDLRRRGPLDRVTIRNITAHLHDSIKQVDGVIAVDAVPEDFGVIGPKVRNELARLGGKFLILADSRRRIGLFRNVLIKPNLYEAARALRIRKPPRASKSWIARASRSLYKRTGRPVFITAEVKGIFVFDGKQLNHSPALAVGGKIDIVGAGDCVAATLCAAICAGATLQEAAEIGNIAASVVIHKLGTTGTASPAEILKSCRKEYRRSGT